VEVQLSRQLESGEALPDLQEPAARGDRTVALAAQGA
jgi:hypothetical protein